MELSKVVLLSFALVMLFSMAYSQFNGFGGLYDLGFGFGSKPFGRPGLGGIGGKPGLGVFGGKPGFGGLGGKPGKPGGLGGLGGFGGLYDLYRNQPVRTRAYNNLGNYPIPL